MRHTECFYLNASSCLASWSSSKTAAMRITLGSALSTNATAATSDNTTANFFPAIAKQQPVGRVLTKQQAVAKSSSHFVWLISSTN